MKSNKTVALLSYSLVIILVFILAPILGQTTIQYVSAETCSGAWDATVSGLKLSYQPGENIDVVVSFKARNPADCPGCIQQILVGMVDQNGKAVDVDCAYNGQAMVCPNWTTGNKAISLRAPSVTGTYKIVAANEYQYNCQDAQKVFLRQPTGPLKEIASINIEAKAPAPTTPPSPGINATPSPSLPGESPTTTSPTASTILVLIAIVVGLGLVTFLIIRKFRKRTPFERVCDAIKQYRLPKPKMSGVEIGYHMALYEYLRSKSEFRGKVKFKPPMKGGGIPDIAINDIAIEVKGPTGANDLHTLVDKCAFWSNDYKKIIFVLFAPTYRPQTLEQVMTLPLLIGHCELEFSRFY